MGTDQARLKLVDLEHAGIRIAAELFPNKPQVAVFDTAFHQALPTYAFHYEIPYEYYEKYRIRRYGFHGTSHHFVGLEAAKRIGKPFEQTSSSRRILAMGAARLRPGMAEAWTQRWD